MGGDQIGRVRVEGEREREVGTLDLEASLVPACGSWRVFSLVFLRRLNAPENNCVEA